MHGRNLVVILGGKGFMRESLAKYEGKYVKILGVYSGKPVSHKKTIFQMNSNGELIHQNDNMETKVFDTVPDGEVISPIKFVKYASCVTDVRGDVGFGEIVEDHINLQEDISELISLNIGDKVRITGNVYKYKKSDSYDYGIKAINVEKW